MNKLGKGRVRRNESSLIFIFSHKYTEKVTRSWLPGNLCTLAVDGKLHLIIATFTQHLMSMFETMQGCRILEEDPRLKQKIKTFPPSSLLC